MRSGWQDKVKLKSRWISPNGDPRHVHLYQEFESAMHRSYVIMTLTLLKMLFCCHKRTILIGICYISIFLLFRRRWGFPIASPNFVFEQLEAESIPIVLPLAPLGSRFLLLVAPVDSKYRRKHLKAEPLNPHFVHLTSKHTWIIWGFLDAEKSSVPAYSGWIHIRWIFHQRAERSPLIRKKARRKTRNLSLCGWRVVYCHFVTFHT